MEERFSVPEPSFMATLDSSAIPKTVKRYKITVAASMGDHGNFISANN